MIKAYSLSIFILVPFLHMFSGTFHSNKLNSNIKYFKKNLATSNNPALTTPLSSFMFKPKLSESNEFNEYLDYETSEDDYYDAFDINPSQEKGSATPPNENQNNLSQLNKNLLFNFVLHLLKPTLKNENTIERLETFSQNSQNPIVGKQFKDHSYEDSSRFYSVNRSNKRSWDQKDNICWSKVTKLSSSFDNPFIQNQHITTCKKKIDSELCIHKIQSGQKRFEIFSTKLCCPNFHLNLDLNECVPMDQTFDIEQELKENILEINKTMCRYLKHINLNRTVKEYTSKIDLIFRLLTDNSLNLLNSTKLTVFLWDNTKFLNYIHEVMGNSSIEEELSRKSKLILKTLENHIVEMHQITQNIFDNNQLVTSLADQNLKFSSIIRNNESYEFVNCEEIDLKNRYHKLISDSPIDDELNFRLLIHKLIPGSLLTYETKSIHDVLRENIFISPSYRIITKIFADTNELFEWRLTNLAPFTLFIQSDDTFKGSLTEQEIEALLSDKQCKIDFVKRNLIGEQICIQSLMKYNLEYTSLAEGAIFKPIKLRNSTKGLLFDKQLVSLNDSKIFKAKNGIVYHLDTIYLNRTSLFLHDVVSYYEMKFSNNFIQSLNSTNWLNTIRRECVNRTLFMPVKINQILDASSGKSRHLRGNKNVETSKQISISDFIVYGKHSYYELNNGDLLTSLSGLTYLVNVYGNRKQIPDFMRFIPSRNFQIKSLNCQQLETPDVHSCSSELILFKSQTDLIPILSQMPLLDFISNDTSLSIFNRILLFCGKECLELFLNAENTSTSRNGYTIILPNNDYFNKQLENFSKHLRNKDLFKKSVLSNIFYGTYCEHSLKYDHDLTNLLNVQIKSTRLVKRIQSAQSYMSKNGILVHLSDQF